VIHQVVVDLWAEEESSLGVKFQSRSELSQEVRASRVVGTADIVAGVIIGIEACTLGANPGGEFRSQVLAKLGNIYSVEVPENRPVWLIAIIDRLACSPRNLSHHAEGLMQ